MFAAMSEPAVIQCTSACTVTVQHQFSVPVPEPDAAQGGAMAAAIGLVRAVGWGIRTLARTLKNVDSTDAER